jgi:hypothetical protein
MVAPGGVVRPEVLANKRLKLSSSRGGGIQVLEAPVANRGVNDVDEQQAARSQLKR